MTGFHPALRPVWIALIAPLAALSLSWLRGFDGLYGQDAYAYLSFATGPLRDCLARLAPPPPFFWPPGYPLLVLASSTVVGMGPLAGQLVSLVSVYVVALFTGLLAGELFPDRQFGKIPLAGLATLLAAVNGQLWLAGSVVMSDAAGLATATVGAWALARYLGGAGSHWLQAAAATTAWATLTRWVFGLVAIPFTIAALIELRRRSRQSRPAALGAAVGAVLIVGLVLAPVWLPLTGDWTASDSTKGGNYEPFLGNLQGLSWSPVNSWQSSFDSADGSFEYRLPMSLFYAAAPARSFAFTPLLAALLIPGVWAVARLGSMAARWLLLGWPVLVLGYHAGSTLQNARFALAVLPPLAVLIAVGVLSLAKRWPAGTKRHILSAALVLGLVAMAAGGVRFHGLFAQQKQKHLELVRWATAQVPADARLLTFNMTLAMRQYSGLEVEELYDLSADEAVAIASDEQLVYVLLDLDSIKRQWKDRAPGINLRALRDRPGLEPVGEHFGWHLLRARPAMRTDS